MTHNSRSGVHVLALAAEAFGGRGGHSPVHARFDDSLVGYAGNRRYRYPAKIAA